MTRFTTYAWQRVFPLLRLSLFVIFAVWAAWLPSIVKRSTLAAPTQPPADCALPRFRQLNSYGFGGATAFGSAVGNFNQDEFSDVVILSFGGADQARRITLYLGDGQGAFRAQPEQVLSENAHLLRVGDFNGDRRMDLLIPSLTANNTQDQLVVWLGSHRTANFTRNASVVLPERLELTGAQIAVTDLNNDNRADVVVSNRSSALTYRVYLSTSDNQLQPGGSGALPADSAFTTGDWDADGKADLIVGQKNPGKVLWMRGNGNGTFAQATELYSAQSIITSIALADFERPGSRNLLITTAQRNGGTVNDRADDSYRLFVLSNNGGAFTQRSLANPFGEIRQVIDLTGDGRPDIQVGGSLVVNSTAPQLCPFASPGNLSSNSSHLTDLNNDGLPDGITVFPNSFFPVLNQGIPGSNTPPKLTSLSESALLTQGVRTFVRLASWFDVESEYFMRVELNNAPAGLRIENLTADGGEARANLTADCKLLPGDYPITLKITDEGGLSASVPITISVLVNPTPAPTISAAPANLVTREGESIIIGVLDEGITPRPGVTHFFRTSNTDLTLRELKLNGVVLQPYFGSALIKEWYYHVTATAAAQALQLTVATLCTQTTRTITLTGTSASETCRYPAFTSPRIYGTGNLSKITLGDFNGDGYNDVAARDNGARQTKIFLAQSDGSLRQVSTTEAPEDYDGLIAADFTRDGKIDLAICSPYYGRNPINQGLTLLAGDGAGNFRRVLRTQTGSGTMVTGDFNRDGHPDLLAHTVLPPNPVNPNGSSFLTVLLNDGKGDFTIKQTFPGGAPALGYLNDDNLLDLVTAGNPMTALIGQADGSFTGLPGFVSAPCNVGAALSGDFDGNGRADFAYSFSANNDGLGLCGFEILGQRIINFAPGDLAAADFNRDGKLDVATNLGRMLVSGTSNTFCSMPQLLSSSAEIETTDLNRDGLPDLIATSPQSGAQSGLQVFLNRTNSLATVSAANYVGATLAPEQIVAAFGAALAPGMQTAATTPLPTTLAGTQVRVRDSAGVERLAPLFFVSGGQVNFMIPSGTALGTATIEIANSSSGTVSVSVTQIVATAPGLFTANATGQGVAAAQALRTAPDNSLRYDTIARLNNNQWEAIPIDLSNANEQTFLILYGTGWRGRTMPGTVTATIGGTSVEVLFAGMQGSLAGLDQANLRLPRSLAGRGLVDVILTINGQVTNVVKANIR